MMKLRQKIYTVLCLVVGMCTLTGCIEKYEADIPTDNTGLLVVEGTICPGENTFILTRSQVVNYSDAPQLVENARVTVRGTDGAEYETDYKSGCYACTIGALNPDVEYYLHIECDGEVYESDPQTPLPTEKIADVRGVQDTPQSDIDILVTPAEPFDATQARYYSWKYDETWEVHPEYTSFVYYDVKLKSHVEDPNYYPRRGWKDSKGNTIMVGSSANYDGQHISQLKLYDISRASDKMFYRYSGLIHQRAITKAEYEYELARRQAGSEMGGLFTPQPSALPTNIHCLTSKSHVIGFVGCSLNTSEYRFFLNESDYSIVIPVGDDDRLWVDNPTHEDCCQLLSQRMVLCEWGDPMNTEDGVVIRTAWARDFQVDVRLTGAYVQEPSYWNSKNNISY